METRDMKEVRAEYETGCFLIYKYTLFYIHVVLFLKAKYEIITQNFCWHLWWVLGDSFADIVDLLHMIIF